MPIDRRSYPRYPLEFPVDVELDAQNQQLEFKAESVNISKASIEINCDNHLIDKLRAQNKYPQTCKLIFKLPGQKDIFKVESQVVTHRRISQNSYYLALVFPALKEEKRDLLEETLSVLQPDIDIQNVSAPS